MKRLVLTGGGTAGHVTPHLALIPFLEEEGYELHYIGTRDGIERSLIPERIPYYSIAAGKLRRYLDWKNLTDPFRVLQGIGQAWKILRKIRPNAIFSKGGFVTVPVAIAGWLLGIPVILHESDYTPGLANRISLRFAKKICLTFPETMRYVPQDKAVVTGTPIRAELARGSRERGLKLCGLSRSRPTLLVMGGSLGSKAINEVVRTALPKVLSKYQVIHLCGRGNKDESINRPGYCQIEYATDELPDLLAAADYVISRAGANSIYELCSLHKPHILVPLSLQASRGDQILNAQSFARQGFSLVVAEEDFNVESLLDALTALESNRESFVTAMERSELADGTANVLREIREITG
ncbi:MAG: undecaprenyldiphospho-muramoylpentapeptide beta-N-acetylglucosaminyltransferase [Firmicutes bacterium]|nr:undecaprenyldiphospho-muramoylpentapeptide beta-N-acetylglucosaminyltransferase [Bacillota bacterium]